MVKLENLGSEDFVHNCENGVFLEEFDEHLPTISSFWMVGSPILGSALG